MSCTTCGSSSNCGCTSSSSTCGDTASGCNSNLVPSSAQPFYACAPACQESNTQKIIINQFSQSLKVANSWNVPACGLTATLSIPGLVSITIGSYLWNLTYGYFEVTAFDSGLQQVTVLNHCNDGNAAVGTAVPACTGFINTAPPAADAESSTPCVKIDFTAPAVSACIDITLTNTTGILAGDVVQIGSGFYRVDEVKPNDIINICNDGDGITPGTSVIALDANGEYQYCLQIISTSPCDRDVVTNAAVVACNSDGQTTTIEMPEDGWIFEGTSASGTNFVGAIPLGLEPFCTRLTAPLSIISGTALYTMTVGDSSGYLLGDIIQVAGYPNITGGPEERFTITILPNSTSITGTFSPNPPASIVMPTGTNVCRIGCCELLQNQVDAIDASIAALPCTPTVFRVAVNSAVYAVPVTLDVDGYFEAVVDASIISVDLTGAACPAAYYAVVAHLSVAIVSDWFINLATNPNSDLGLLYHEIEASWSAGGIPANRTAGKIVYTEILMDSVLSFPAVPEATFTHLQIAPLLPLMYHQNDVAALAIMPPGGGITNIGLSYRTKASTAELVSIMYDSASFLVSGWIDIYPING